jgi:hypothetical protein
MSIEAKISRKLLIESPQQLNQILLKTKQLLDKHLEFKIFSDTMFLYTNGCKCDSDFNWTVIIEIYKAFDKLESSTIEDLKHVIGCDSIIFNLEGKKLFEV